MSKENEIGIFSDQDRWERRFRLGFTESVVERIQEYRKKNKIYSAPSHNVWPKIFKVRNY